MTEYTSLALSGVHITLLRERVVVADSWNLDPVQRVSIVDGG
jgi:hypothetical protein